MPGLITIGITIFLILLISFIVYTFIKYKYPFEFYDNIFVPFLKTLIITVISCFILGLAHSWEKAPCLEPVASYNLIGMVDENCYGGYGYLRHFLIEKEPKYFYMYEDDFGMKQTTVNTNECYIRFIVGDQTPMIYIYNYEYTNAYVQWLLGSPSNQMFIFFIPEESIICDNNYEIDLK